jgi:hypothetical protein
MSLDERPRGSTRPTPKAHYNTLPRTSIEGALGNSVIVSVIVKAPVFYVGSLHAGCVLVNLRHSDGGFEMRYKSVQRASEWESCCALDSPSLSNSLPINSNP